MSSGPWAAGSGSAGQGSPAGRLVPSGCGAFPPVDGFGVGGHAVEEIGDELGVGAAVASEAELPEFCGGPVVVVDRLIHGIGVDLAGAVAVDRCPDVAEQFGQLRLVVAADPFPRGAPFSIRGHDGTVPCLAGAAAGRARQPSLIQARRATSCPYRRLGAPDEPCRACCCLAQIIRYRSCRWPGSACWPVMVTVTGWDLADCRRGDHG